MIVPKNSLTIDPLNTRVLIISLKRVILLLTCWRLFWGFPLLKTSLLPKPLHVSLYFQWLFLCLLAYHNYSNISMLTKPLHHKLYGLFLMHIWVAPMYLFSWIFLYSTYILSLGWFYATIVSSIFCITHVPNSTLLFVVHFHVYALLCRRNLLQHHCFDLL